MGLDAALYARADRQAARSTGAAGRRRAVAGCG